MWPGFHQLLGATWTPDSTNFAVWSPEATAMWVCLFDDDGDEVRHQLTEHTLGVWHGAVPGVRPGQRYGFRADGPWDPAHGRRFNPEKLLLDPYARAISGERPTRPGPAPLRRGRPDESAAPSTRPPRCRAPWSCTTTSTGETTGGCGTAGATR